MKIIKKQLLIYLRNLTTKKIRQKTYGVCPVFHLSLSLQTPIQNVGPLRQYFYYMLIAETIPDCEDGYAQCLSGLCISERSLCNGSNECPRGEDESTIFCNGKCIIVKIT